MVMTLRPRKRRPPPVDESSDDEEVFEDVYVEKKKSRFEKKADDKSDPEFLPAGVSKRKPSANENEDVIEQVDL